MELFADFNWVAALAGAALSIGAILTSKSMRETFGKMMYGFALVALVVVALK